MGDMADMAFDDMMDYEDARWDYRHGLLDTEEAYDMGIIDEYGFEDFE